MTDTSVTASDWIKGISLSVLASIIGGASKLAIRKSWLIQQERVPLEEEQQQEALSNPPEEELGESSNWNQSLRYRPARSTEEEEVDNTEEDSNDDDESPRSRRHNNCLAYTLRGSGMIGMTFLNPLCCVFAMNYASPSILAPFSGLTLVWIVLLSHPLIGERPSSRQVVAASLIILGEVVVGLFGDHTNDEGVTVSDIVSTYHRSTLFGCCSVLYLTRHRSHHTSVNLICILHFYCILESWYYGCCCVAIGCDMRSLALFAGLPGAFPGDPLLACKTFSKIP